MTTLVVSIPALCIPTLVQALQQDPQAMARGQWWRLLTPMLVQGSGLGQLIFNVGGIIIVGAAVERWFGGWRWLLVYLGSGTIAVALTSLWSPDRTDSGASAAVAGLIGALMIGVGARPDVAASPPSLLYCAFFAVYLSAMALGGAIAGALAGSLVAPAGALVRRRLTAAGLHDLVVAVVLVACLALVAVRDVHGLGLGAGLALGSALRPPARTSRPLRGGHR